MAILMASSKSPNRVTDRPEDLFLEDPPRAVALEDRRLDVEAAGQVAAQVDPVAADGHLGALGFADPDLRVDRIFSSSGRHTPACELLVASLRHLPAAPESRRCDVPHGSQPDVAQTLHAWW